MFEFIARYFWVLGLASGAVNYFFLKKNIQAYIEEDPSREPGYNQFLTWFITFYTLVWLLMGAAILSHPQENAFTFLQGMSSGGWASRTFWAFFLTVWGSWSAWVVFGKGAEFLEQHPGLIKIRVPGVDPERPSAKAIRNVSIAAFVVSLAVFYLFYSQNDALAHQRELPEHHTR